MEAAETQVSPYTCLGQEGTVVFRQVAVAIVSERLPATPAPTDVLGAFSTLYTGFWQIHSLVIGPLGVAAVMARAVRVAAARQPVLALVEVSEEGLSLARLQADATLSPIELREALLDLFCTAQDLLCSLIGVDLVEPMLRRLERLYEGRESGLGH